MKACGNVTRAGGTESTAQNPLLMVQSQVKSDVDDWKTASGNGQAWSLQVPEGSGEQGNMEKTGCKIICGAPMTLMVKGLMLTMMMMRLSLFI